MTQTPKPHWTPAQRVYSAWLVAARTIHQSSAAVIDAMRTYLLDNDLMEGLGDTWAKKSARLGSQYGYWEQGRTKETGPYPPDRDAVRTALIAVVSSAVPRPPEHVRVLAVEHGWTTFNKVVNALRNAKETSTSQQGQKAAENAHTTDRTRRTRDLAATTPLAAALLDPHTLNLGSWMFDGKAPPYVPRTIDAQLTERLTTANTGLTVVVGPPKSGKSRSVLETLARTLPNETVQWINPAPGVLPALVELRRKDKKNTDTRVIVLDDAQFLGVNPTDGLTVQRLTELAERSQVIVIIHEDDLSSWRKQINNRRVTSDMDLSQIGATPELVNLLVEHRINYPPVLDDNELAAATELLDAATSSAEGLDFTRLAEVLASVDHFKADADEALAAGGIRAALIEAAIDATILYPTGAELEQLEQLCTLHYRQLRPNLPWRTTQFDDAFDWAATGYKGSPHATLTRAPGAGQRYRLFDALIPHLRNTDRTLHHLRNLDLDSSAEFKAGAWSYEVAEPAAASFWFKRSAEHGHVLAMYNLGILANKSGDPDTARIWWTQAAEHGQHDAMFGLGILADKSGDPDTARIWWTQVADGGDTAAMFGLGMLARDSGDPDTARTWWTQAADGGHTSAMRNLAILARDSGDPDTARIWWTQVADGGDTAAMFSLGILADKLGDPDTARTWWTQVADGGDTAAMFGLGMLAYKLGDPDTARTWWTQAVEHGQHDAMFGLGLLSRDSGDPDTARIWWEKAAATGSEEARKALEELKGDDKEDDQ